jgi:drug/metabolite transporter (DMT)-like permease
VTPSQITPPVPPWLILAGGVLAVSGGAIFVRLAEAPSLTIAAYRTGLATLCLLPAALARNRAELRRLEARDLARCLIAGVFLALHFAAWISSLAYTPVANSVVLVNTNPLWVGLLTPWITGERIGRATVLSIAASLVGVAIIGAGDFAASREALLGDGLALIGGLCAAVYLLLGRDLRRRLSLLSYTSLCYGAAALILWLLVLGLGLPITGFTLRTWTALAGMALISQIIGHTCANWALRWFSASLIAVSLLGEPVISSLLAYLLFGERLGPSMLIGGAVVLAAIVLCARAEAADPAAREAAGAGGAPWRPDPTSPAVSRNPSMQPEPSTTKEKPCPMRT